MAQSVISTELFSAALGRVQSITILPPDVFTPDGRCFMLLLLHGMGGDAQSWPNNIDIASLFGGMPIMAAMPSAENSFYMNSDMAQMETFICDELTPWLDQNYPTYAAPAGRGLTGFSMGGYGALLLALRRPDLFGSAASHGGAVLTSRATREVGVKWELADQLYGLGPEGEVNRREHDLLTLAQRRLSIDPETSALSYTGPRLYLDCGADDFLYYASRELTQAFRMLRVPYEYHESPGDHNWDYCRKSLPASIAFHLGAIIAG